MQVRLTPLVEKMLKKALPIARKRGHFNSNKGSATMLANGILWTKLRKMNK